MTSGGPTAGLLLLQPLHAVCSVSDGVVKPFPETLSLYITQDVALQGCQATEARRSGLAKLCRDEVRGDVVWQWDAACAPLTAPCFSLGVADADPAACGPVAVLWTDTLATEFPSGSREVGRSFTLLAHLQGSLGGGPVIVDIPCGAHLTLTARVAYQCVVEAPMSAASCLDPSTTVPHLPAALDAETAGCVRGSPETSLILHAVAAGDLVDAAGLHCLLTVELLRPKVLKP